jgi:hypothetical protein
MCAMCGYPQEGELRWRDVLRKLHRLRFSEVYLVFGQELGHLQGHPCLLDGHACAAFSYPAELRG